MKDKGSGSVAECLKKYFALHGKPKSVFSEDCNSFRYYVDYLLNTYNITHVTCNDHKKRTTEQYREPSNYIKECLQNNNHADVEVTENPPRV